QAQRFSIGQYWDSGRDIRSAIQGNLAMISGKDLDWQRLTANTEWLGIRMEAESDLARRQEARDKPPRSPDGSRYRDGEGALRLEVHTPPCLVQTRRCKREPELRRD